MPGQLLAISLPLSLLLFVTADDNPLLQAHRPPPQTHVQEQVRTKNVANAPGESAEARSELLSMLSCDSHKCINMDREELLELLTYEFERLPLIHNGPVYESEVGDDTDLITSLQNGYLQNVIHRYVLGFDKDGHAAAEGKTMERFFGYPRYKNLSDPTLCEANDRMLFLANNWQKASIGNTQYGSVTYVINPLVETQLFVAPADSGIHKGLIPLVSASSFAIRTFPNANVLTTPTCIQFGTMKDFLHVVVEHLHIYDYSISEIFREWYDRQPGGGALRAARGEKCTGALQQEPGRHTTSISRPSAAA
jgi:hypothetical protein